MAACSRCSGLMQYVPEKNMLKCPFCGNEEPLEQMINVENLNVTSGVLDADTMFENWIVSGGNGKLEEDFFYYYATDSRSELIKLRHIALSSGYVYNRNNQIKAIEEYKTLVNKFFAGERFGKYRDSELEKCNGFLQYHYEQIKRDNEKEADRQRVEQIRQDEEQRYLKRCKIQDILGGIALLIGIIVIIAFLVYISG